MQTEYQQSLENWAKNLSDETLGRYMDMLDRFKIDELDALLREDLNRIYAKFQDSWSK
jgi:hypothetical protein